MTPMLRHIYASFNKGKCAKGRETYASPLNTPSGGTSKWHSVVKVSYVLKGEIRCILPADDFEQATHLLIRS